MRGCIAFGPTRLTDALDISCGGEVAQFSQGLPTDPTGSHVPQASGMKPVLQSSAEASGSGPFTIAIGGVQPHDTVGQLQRGTRT